MLAGSLLLFTFGICCRHVKKPMHTDTDRSYDKTSSALCCQTQFSVPTTVTMRMPPELVQAASPAISSSSLLAKAAWYLLYINVDTTLYKLHTVASLTNPNLASHSLHKLPNHLSSVSNMFKYDFLVCVCFWKFSFHAKFPVYNLLKQTHLILCHQHWGWIARTPLNSGVHSTS